MCGSPDLSVIMVTHQGRQVALDALRTARAATGPVEVEWFVVDSGSSDGTPDAVEQAWPDITVDRQPNIGFAAGNNRALARARGRYILLLNPDMEIVRGTLAALVQALDTRPQVGAASVVQQWPDGVLQPTMRCFPSPARQLGEALMLSRLPPLKHLREEEPRAERYDDERSADWLVGGFLLVRREAIREVGGLDERFFLFSEETDWCRRLRAAGWDIRHFPLMRVTHHTGRSARPDLYAQNSFSKLLYSRKHFSRPAQVAFRAALVLRHAVRAAGFAPAAAVNPALRMRLSAERRALLVVLGLLPPPFRPYRASGAASPDGADDVAHGCSASSRLPSA
jgi:GT2 family glycosyltransferase